MSLKDDLYQAADDIILAQKASRAIDARVAFLVGTYKYLLKGLGDDCEIVSVTYVPEYDQVNVLARSIGRDEGGLIYSPPLPAFTGNREAAAAILPKGWSARIVLEDDSLYCEVRLTGPVRKDAGGRHIYGAVAHGDDAEPRARTAAVLRALADSTE